MNETKSRHIDLIQATIGRMAQNSFFIKGWTITILVGLFVFLKSDNLKNNYIIYMLPIIGFWLLDSFYLWQERLYRNLYENVIQNLEQKSDLKMSTQQFRASEKYYSAFFSITELLTYIPLLIVVILIINL